MSEFKIGDKVRFNNRQECGRTGKSWREGDTGTVTGVDDDGWLAVDGSECVIYPPALELIEEAT